jgi:flagellar biosynthesis/type III secretory pathway ATPase
METRKTSVSWDPKLVRVEVLDHEGNPLDCWFEESNSDEYQLAKASPETRVRPAVFQRLHQGLRAMKAVILG